MEGSGARERERTAPLARVKTPEAAPQGGSIPPEEGNNGVPMGGMEYPMGR